jgi:poly(A) polymerase
VANDRAHVEAVAHRLRLSNAIRNRMIAASTVAASLDPDMTDHAARAAIFHDGKAAFVDAVFIASARNQPPWPRDRMADLLSLADRFTPPTLPVSGQDLLALGIEAGRNLGEKLKSLKDAWIASDFTLTKQALLDRLADKD